MTTKAETEIYNGYTNYETWAVSLWIDNEEHTQTAWRDKATEVWESNEDTAPDYLTRSQHVRSILADALKEWAEASAPDLGASIWADLLNAALSEVDWIDIADNLLSGMDGYESRD